MICGEGGAWVFWLFVQEGLAEPALLEGAARRLRCDPQAKRAMELAASFLRGRPKATLAEVGAELSRMGVRPRSGEAWAISSVKALLDRARSAELLSEGHGQRRRRRAPVKALISE
jgi:hypothetical protein